MPTTGHFVIRANVLPPVTAGSYDLVSDETGTPFEVATKRTRVKVSAPRYTMPHDQVLSSFPPANAEGAFGDRLPQIVLKRRTLPWERNPHGAVSVSSTPWLALVVVAEGEAEISRDPRPVAECVTPGTVLRDPDDRDVDVAFCLTVTETVVRALFPCEEDLPLLAHVREVDVDDTELANGDDDGFLAVVLANRLPVLDAASGKPVRYSACLVNLEGQLHELPPPSPPEDTFGWHLVQDWSHLATASTDLDKYVAGGGLPRSSGPGGLERLGEQGDLAASRGPLPPPHLDGSAVLRDQQRASSGWSLQASAAASAAISAAAQAPDATAVVRDRMKVGFHFPIEIYAAERVLRFPVLAHWSFTTTEGATFETLVQDLDVGLLGSLPEPDPAAPPRPAPSPVVASGHVQLDHRTRRGDTSRAWYRGPFVPHPADREQRDDEGRLTVAHAADQLRRVVPDGTEDVGYAAAFEIGRLLALSQLSVVSALLRFRSEQFGTARLREVVREAVPWGVGELSGHDLRHQVARSLLARLAEEPAGFAGPRRPVADPGRPVEELAGTAGEKLDALVARGLGIDLERLREHSRAVGLVTALARTEVPVARTEGLDDADVDLLRRSLDTHVERLAAMAKPRRVRPEEGHSDDRSERDALDALLDRLPGRDGSWS